MHVGEAGVGEQQKQEEGLSQPQAVPLAKDAAERPGLLQSACEFPEMQSWMLRGMHCSQLAWITPQSRRATRAKKDPDGDK